MPSRSPGRGELQLGVLIETMRREGFEISDRPAARASSARTRRRASGMEPIEEVQIDVDDEHTGIVVEKLGLRRGELMDMRPSGGAKTRMTFLVPSRGLIGYHGEFLTDTRGTGIMSRLFHAYLPLQGADRGTAQRRADLQRRRQCGRLCALVSGGARPDVHQRRAPRSMRA